MEFVIYGKENCSYCQLAKRLLTQKEFYYEYLTLDKDFTLEHLLDLIPEAKTFPQIMYIENDISAYVGGYDDLVKFISSISWENKLIEALETNEELRVSGIDGISFKIKYISQVGDGSSEVRVQNIETGETFNLKYASVFNYDVLANYDD